MKNKGTLWDQLQEQPLMDFREARAIARSLCLSGREEWDAFVLRPGVNLPETFPLKPDEAYSHLGWKGWDDWLGIEKKEESGPAAFPSGLWDQPGDPWRPFEEAREIARRYAFGYREEWEAFVKGLFPERPPLPGDVPAEPDRVYRFSGWKGWDDWLVPPEGRKNYSSFHKAREFVHCFRFPDKPAWREGMILLQDKALSYGFVIPEKPQLEYAGKGWTGWDDWLGKEIPFASYIETRRFIHGLGLENREEWYLYCQGLLPRHPRKPRNIFAYPDIAYAGTGWTSWEDWLGTDFGKAPAG